MFSAAGHELRAQSNVETTQAGILFSDTVQQIFVIMPQGTIELKPIDLELYVAVDDAKGVAHIKTNTQKKRISYTIYDANGNALISDEGPAEAFDIDISSLAAGQYILQAIDGKRQQRYRLIKSK